MAISIDEEFRSLIPPLSKEELDGLEQNIKRHGCHTPVVVWRGILVDGHNRLDICRKHNKSYETRDIEFSNRHEAKCWIIKNQLDRRNLSTTDRIDLGLLLKSEIQMAAQVRMKAGVKKNPKENLPEGAAHNTQTRDEVAALAGVSGRTLDKYEKVKDKGTPEILAAVKEGKVSISAASKVVDLPEQEQRDIAALPKGEAKRAAVEATRTIAEPESISAIDKLISLIKSFPPADEMAAKIGAIDKAKWADIDCAVEWMISFSESIHNNK